MKTPFTLAIFLLVVLAGCSDSAAPLPESIDPLEQVFDVDSAAETPSGIGKLEMDI